MLWLFSSLLMMGLSMKFRLNIVFSWLKCLVWFWGGVMLVI